jgi:hypothetical protein
MVLSSMQSRTDWAQWCIPVVLATEAGLIVLRAE